MTTIYAVWDGEVLRPDQSLHLAPNTRVRVTIEAENVERTRPEGTASFLKTAQSLQLDGPPDWSSRLNDYLYGSGDGT
jgi:hypothetical protein